MSANPELKITISADANGVKAGTQQAEAAINALSQGGSNALQKLATEFAQLTASVLAIKAGLDSLIGSTQQALEVGMTFEKLGTQMKFATGSAEEGAAAMEYVRDVSNRLGIELTGAAESYAKLASASRGTALAGDETKLAFEAIATASRVMGLSTEETNGALLALSQMISKGKVAAEELRGQLGERLPGAFQIAARAMGVTTGKLDEMLQSGLNVADFLPKFSRQLLQEMGGAAAEAANSLSASIARMNNAWTEFMLAASNSGPMKQAAQSINELMDALSRDPEVRRAAETLGGAMATAIKAAGSAAEFAVKHLDLIGDAAIALGGPLVLGAVVRLGKALKTLLLSPMGRVIAGMTILVETSQWLGEKIGELVHGPLPDFADQFGKVSTASVEAAGGLGALAAQTGEAAGQSRALTGALNASAEALTQRFTQAVAGAGAQARDAKSALQDMLKAADFGTMTGLDALGAALKDIEAKGLVAGQVIDRELRERIAKMNIEELRAFEINLRAALDSGAAGAQRLGELLGAVVDVGLANLGVAAQTALGGMSDAFNKTNESLSLVLGNLDTLKAAGIDTGAALSQALDAMLKAASTEKDFAALAATVKQLGDEGLITKRKTDELLDAIRDKSDAAKDGINSVAEAFRVLGVRSDADIQRAIDKLREANDAIQQSGASLREKQAAFAAYANEVLRSGTEMQKAMVLAQAEAKGLAIEVDNAGRATVKLKQEADGIAEKYGKAADEAKRLADKTKETADESERAAQTINRIKAPGAPDDRPEFTLSRQMLQDIADGRLQHAFVTPAMARESLAQSEQMAIEQEIARRKDQEWNDKIRAEVDRRLGVAKSEPTKTVNVNLRLPNGREVTVATTGGTEQNLLDALKAMGLRS